MCTINSGCGKISQKHRSYFLFQPHFSFPLFICLSYCFAHICTMAEAAQGIRAPPTKDVQSILEGKSENDSQ